LDGATLSILATFSLVGIFLFGLMGAVRALKELFDQLPDFFASIRRAWESWQELKRVRREGSQPPAPQELRPPAEEQEPPADDEDVPPMAA